MTRTKRLIAAIEVCDLETLAKAIKPLVRGAFFFVLGNGEPFLEVGGGRVIWGAPGSWYMGAIGASRRSSMTDAALAKSIARHGLLLGESK